MADFLQLGELGILNHGQDLEKVQYLLDHVDNDDAQMYICNPQGPDGEHMEKRMVVISYRRYKELLDERAA